MTRSFALLCMTLLGLAAGLHAFGAQAADVPKAAKAGDDLLCKRAPEGTVAKPPVPFNHWLVVVCAAQGQALVPVEGMVWKQRGSGATVAILALPPDSAPLVKAPGYDPRYRVRFTALLAAEVKGDKVTRVKQYLTRAVGNEKVPDFDRIFQLDAVSSIYELRYNIYFYIRGKQPVMGLVCLGQCAQAMAFDIVIQKKTGPAS